MKLQLLGALFAGATLLLTLQSVSGGRAAIGGQDRTGAPGALSTDCSLCHAVPGSFANPQLNIFVKDASGATVTSYVPGDTYNVEFFVASNGLPAGYGMQAVILDASNNNAGDFLTTTTAKTQLVTISNGREIIEQQGISAANAFKATWEAPASGTGDVTIYGVGIACDGNGSTSGDNVSPTAQLTLTESPASSIDAIPGEKLSLELFPIPNNGSFNIKSNGKGGKAAIRVIDLQGKVVYEEDADIDQFGTHSIYCKNLVPGTYAVEIEIEGSRQVEPMVVL